ncbi:MAG: tryptophan halogenase family protein [Pseudomonadota bacterium]
MGKPIERIAIVGGGTAGWIAASVLARRLKGACKIELIESAEIATVGVGEATIPPILDLLTFLGIDEADFIKATQASIKLGVKFKDWREHGHSYWHPFGGFGAVIDRRPFYHYLQRARAEGLSYRVPDFSLAATLGDAGKVLFPRAGEQGAAASLRYALHFDASLVARYLRAYAERSGVVRHERTIRGASLRADGGVAALTLEGGDELRADLYLDCSGFRGLLIEGALKTGYQDWTRWLPCDRAVAAPTQYKEDPAPYTLSTALGAGWRWRIPLQHRAGNGYVYSSAHISDDQARTDLLRDVGEEPLAEPRVLRFVTGRRNLFWNKNCVALGLASGFLEPLESTSIQFIINGVYNLIDHFPDQDFDPANIASYNTQLIDEFETVRDFIVLHYCTTRRSDTPFWRDCAAMAAPDALRARIDLYRGTGRIFVKPVDLFTDLSWFFVLDGMGVTPQAHDPLADIADFGAVRGALERLAAEVRTTAAAGLGHSEVLNAILRAP